MAFKGSDVWKIISKLKRIYNLDKSNNILANQIEIIPICSKYSISFFVYAAKKWNIIMLTECFYEIKNVLFC